MVKFLVLWSRCLGLFSLKLLLLFDVLVFVLLLLLVGVLVLLVLVVGVIFVLLVYLVRSMRIVISKMGMWLEYMMMI